MQIHELDNYTGDLDSTAYAAIDNGNDTGKVAVPTILAEVNSDINTLNERVDNLLSGLTQDSEVIDARLGADGTLYDSLGAAVREQFDSVNANMDLFRKKAKILISNFAIEEGSIDSSGSNIVRNTHERTADYLTSIYPLYVDATAATDTVLIRAYNSSKTFLRSYSVASGSVHIVKFASDVAYYRIAVKDGFSTIKLYQNNTGAIVSSEWVTPEMFGAIGNGTNDDADAIQAAINYAIDNSVNFRCGSMQYAITKQINIDVSAANGYDEQTPLTFDFMGSRIKANSDIAFDNSFTSTHFTSGKGFMIRVSNPANHHQVIVKNINIWCENRANGLLLIDCHRADLQNVFIHYPHGNGVWCCYDESSSADRTFGQTLLTNTRIVAYAPSGDLNARDICALYASVSDFIIENLFYQNCLKGLFVGGGQIRAHCVHGYTSVASYVASYALRAGNQSKVVVSDLYADSTNYAIYASKNADVQVIGLEYLGNESGDLVNLLDSHPLTIVGYYGSMTQTGIVDISNAIITIPSTVARMEPGTDWFGSNNICSVIATSASQGEIDAFIDSVPGGLKRG